MLTRILSQIVFVLLAFLAAILPLSSLFVFHPLFSFSSCLSFFLALLFLSILTHLDFLPLYSLAFLLFIFPFFLLCPFSSHSLSRFLSSSHSLPFFPFLPLALLPFLPLNVPLFPPLALFHSCSTSPSWFYFFLYFEYCRHPSNLMLDRLSGGILHIDFGDCFEVCIRCKQLPSKITIVYTSPSAGFSSLSDDSDLNISDCEIPHLH